MAIDSPVNPVPPVVVILFAAVMAVEGMLSLGAAGLVGGPGAVGWRIAAIQDWGISPAVFERVVQRGDLSPGLLVRFVSYPFVFGDFTSALFGGALLLALGKFVGDVMHGAAVLALFFGSAIAGALVYGAVVQENVALYGVYPPVYGLIGGFTYLIWQRLGQSGSNRLAAFRLIGLLLGLQLVWSLLFGSNPWWVAELAGFVTGFAMSVLLAPGGWVAFVDRMRSR